MGKREDRQNIRQIDHRGRSQGQKGLRYASTLVACFLALGTGTGANYPQSTDDTKTFSPDLAWRSLLKQCKFGPRKPGTPAHRACRDYIVDELKKSCTDVRLEPFSHTWSITHESIPMWNIVADQNWKSAKTRVVLFAHWDCRPEADQDRDPANRNKPILGANDAASGVAVLIELARVLKDSLPPDVGVEYVMTDGEDLGPGEDEMYLGADLYAKEIAASTTKPTYGILLDMIGQKDLVVPKEINSIRYVNKLETALYEHAAKVGLGKTFPNVDGEEIDDDHLPMIKAGLPTIDLIEFGGYAPWWHTLQDTEDKCSAESLGKVGKLLQTWLQKSPSFSL